MTQKTSVLIVGAGPVGLMLAILLKKRGISCRIIDKLINRQGYCKALGIQPRTLEVWENVNLLTPMLNEGLCFKQTKIFQDGKEVYSEAISIPELPFGFLSIPQFKLEEVLVNEAQALGLTIEQGIELLELEQGSQGVKAVLANNNTGSSEKIIVDYLVGCDGAHSQTRKLLGLSFEGGKFPEFFMLADIRVNWEYEHQTNYRFSYKDEGIENTVVFVPYRGDRRFRISMTVPESLRAEIKDGKPTLEQFAALVAKAVPVKVELDAMRWSSMYQISHRIVNQYASGRVFLAGDAAHIHPPVGGQGLNTGIQDVYNLAWKLTLVLKNQAKPSLLSSYHEERHPVGLEVVNRTHERMVNKSPAMTNARYMLLANSQTLVNYQNSSLSKGDCHPADPKTEWTSNPGDRAPDVSLLKRDITNFSSRLFEILRGNQFNVLLYADASLTKDFLDSAEGLQDSLRFLANTYLIAPKDFHLSENSSLTLLTDLEDNFKRIYKAKAGAVYLIRPDNYIAYHSLKLNKEALMNYLQESLQVQIQLTE